MFATANDDTLTLTMMQKRLEPLYRGISSVIQQIKDRKHAVPKDLTNLQSECSTLDRKIESLVHNEDIPAADMADIDQEVGSLQARVVTAIAPFEK